MRKLVHWFTGNKRLSIPIALMVASVLAGGTMAMVAWAGSRDGPVNRTITFEYDRAKEKWVKTENAVALVPSADGTRPRGSNTVIIRLNEDDPVKKIKIENALVKGGTEPILEIAGQTDALGTRGRINIGVLSFTLVDAERLKIHDTDVVQLTVSDTVVEDNELDIDVNAVNVVRVARGAMTIITIGTRDPSTLAITSGGDAIVLPSEDEAAGGIRIDRIRILGPQGKTAFVEKIEIIDTGVMGNIEIRDLRVQDIVLSQVSLDDSVP